MFRCQCKACLPETGLGTGLRELNISRANTSISSKKKYWGKGFCAGQGKGKTINCSSKNCGSLGFSSFFKFFWKCVDYSRNLSHCCSFATGYGFLKR